MDNYLQPPRFEEERLHMRGRKPKPTALRLLDGNAGHRPINRDEPIPLGDLGAAPDWFTPAQKQHWDIALSNAPIGMLKRLDASTLAVWSIAADLHQRACEAQAKLDASTALPLLTKSPSGMAMQSPYLGIVNRQALIMLRAASELGFTPSSRSRVKTNAASAKANRFARFKSTATG
jgi:P27 family predicted phage terminase small subunit